MPGPRLAAKDVQKAFGATLALAGVSFAIEPGRVHALIGENGAGKSTLMSILAGATVPDAGELTLDGAAFRPHTPEAARRAGVAMVHQELSLCPHLSVEENITLGDEPARFGFVQRAEMRRRAVAALGRVSAASTRLSADARVGDLPPSAQQLVEIARALALPKCRVLILDEPTSSLGAGDVDQLFSVIRSVCAEGMAVIYISHFLEEIHRIADDFTVLRDGETVGTGALGDVTTGAIVEMMVGRTVAQLFPRSPRTAGEVVIAAKDVTGAVNPQGVSFVLRRGEVLGLAGLVGSGRTELLRCLFGLDGMKKGELRVLGISGFRAPPLRIAQGVGFLSEDRKGEGLATTLSLAENLTLSRTRSLGPAGIVLPRRRAAAAQKWMRALAIRARGADQPVGELSGGNQQKVALARLLHQDADVYLLDEPTRGIDVGSKAQIYELIDGLAAAGKAVLVVSSYLPELLGICDRIAVMRRGHLGPARPAAELDERAVLMEATGA
ncbi:MAG TPA: sugar ABC transporter ATP-binding protein [Polyangiaceae bacterium]|nr:sugar ABC transporter ATP-binding protein [Polyangiaceae bacterium]